MEWFYEIFEDWKNQNIPSKHASGKVEYGVFKGLAQRPRISSDEYRNELERVSVINHMETANSKSLICGL